MRVDRFVNTCREHTREGILAGQGCEEGNKTSSALHL